MYAARHLVALLLLLSACAVDEAKAHAVADTSVDTSDTSVERWRGSGSAHPVVDYFGTADGVWDTEHMNDPGINQQDGKVDATGANPGCVRPEGVYNLHGNLHEWVADAEETFKGGVCADGSVNGAGCAYTTTAHTTDHRDYSTGFRCCADATE